MTRGGVVGRVGLAVAVVALVMAACDDPEADVNHGWRTDQIATPAAVPVVVGDRVVVADTDGGLVGLDAASGEAQWRWEAPQEIEPVIAAVGDGVAVSVPGQDDPKLCLVAAADGDQRWCRDVDARSFGMVGLGRPLVDGNDDTLVTFAVDGVARAFATDRGEPVWEVVVQEADDLIGPHALLVADDVAVFGTTAMTDDGAGEVVALDVATGDVLWRTHFAPSLGEHGFARHGGDVVVHAAGRIARFDLRTGAVRWDTSLPAPPVGRYSLAASAPVVVGGLVIALPRVTLAVPGEGSVLVGLDAASGQPRWSQDEPPRVAALSRARHYAGLGAMDGLPALLGEDLSVLDPATGAVRRAAEFGLEAGTPWVAIGEGVVLVDDAGQVRRVDP